MSLFSEFLIKDPETAWKKAGKPKVDLVAEGRKKLIENIKEAAKQFKAGETAPKRGLYKIKGDLAQVTLKAGRRIIQVEGNDRSVVKADKLADFFDLLIKAAEASTFDHNFGEGSDALVALATGKPMRKKPVMSEEAKAARSAKMKEAWAKRKAAKTKA